MEKEVPRHELTIAEKKMVVKCYQFFELEKAAANYRGSRTREIVHKCVGVKPATVARVWGDYKRDPQHFLEESEAESTRGRHRSFSVEEIAPTIKEFVVTQNKKAIPITAQEVANHVESVHDIEIPRRTMSDLMHELGYHHVRGEKRHIYMESAGNVAFRAKYLARKVANRVVLEGRRGKEFSGVGRPEVYLDESFCNVNHVTGKTWLTADKIRYAKSGKGARACIVAAGIIYSKGAITTGQFVPGSYKVWNSALKRKHWEEDDYNGNFNASLFEKWFKELCENLKLNYGECNIHLDGASYHKRQTNKAPVKGDTRKEIITWLKNHVGGEIDFTVVKDDLIKIVDQHRPKPSYRVVELAAEHGHHVYYTPPYHPSLQPIELIWAQTKGPIARHPANNAAETIQKVEEGLKAVENQWVSLFRHVQKIEDAFIKAATRPDGSNVDNIDAVAKEKDS